MPDYDDSLGGQTMGGEDNEDRFEKSLGDENTMGGDTDINSLGDASTMGDANTEDDWDDGDMELVDLSARYTEEGVLGKGGMGEVLPLSALLLVHPTQGRIQPSSDRRTKV